MINLSDFKDGEFARALTQLHTFNRANWRLKEELNQYFQEFDDDKNEVLDIKELR